MHHCVDGWVSEHKDGWMPLDGWVGEWMDGCIQHSVHRIACIDTKVSKTCHWSKYPNETGRSKWLPILTAVGTLDSTAKSCLSSLYMDGWMDGWWWMDGCSGGWIMDWRMKCRVDSMCSLLHVIWMLYFSKLSSCFYTTCHLKRYHASKMLHLLLCYLIARVGRQSRVIHSNHLCTTPDNTDNDIQTEWNLLAFGWLSRNCANARALDECFSIRMWRVFRPRCNKNASNGD